jgi:hypothetical protein
MYRPAFVDTIITQRPFLHESGDWLAVALGEYCQSGESLILEKLEKVAKDNLDALPKLDPEKLGYRGRLRMVIGLQLRAVAKKQGFVVIGAKPRLSTEESSHRGTRHQATRTQGKASAAHKIRLRL